MTVRTDGGLSPVNTAISIQQSPVLSGDTPASIYPFDR